MWYNTNHWNIVIPEQFLFSYIKKILTSYWSIMDFSEKENILKHLNEQIFPWNLEKTVVGQIKASTTFRAGGKQRIH